MAITRRDFLKISGATGAGTLLGVFDLKPIAAYAQANPPVWEASAVSIGPYCSGGCAVLVGYKTTGPLAGYATYVQGYPDSPINKGRICSKCGSSAQLSTIVSDDSGTRVPNPERLTKVLKRAAYSSTWTEISWSQAISEIATKVANTRDAGFVETEGSLTVNRCPNIGVLGGSSLNNQAAYLISKLSRALGIVYLETQARN